MNKVCGYSCEHNKGGVCQITMCDKQLTFSTTTEKNIEELKQMIEPLKDWKFWEYNCSDEDVKKAMENKSYIEVVLEEQSKTIKELQQELQRKDNIINELEEWLNDELKKNTKWYDTELSSHDKRYYEKDFIISQSVLRETLNKLNELKEKKQ